MNYLQKKKLAFMSIVNSVKGFVRNITGVFPLTLPNCVDEESITDYTIYGNSVQDGTPTPDNPIEVECVGEKTKNLVTTTDGYIANYGASRFIKYESATQEFTVNGFGLMNYVYLPETIPSGTTTSIYAEIVNDDYELVKGSLAIGGYGTNNSWQNNISFNATKSKTQRRVYTATADTDKICFFVDVNAEVKNVKVRITYAVHDSLFEEFEPYGYKIPIIVSGKNLISNWNAGWCTAQGVLNTTDYPNRRYTDFIPIKPNTSYYVSGGGTNSNWTVYDENYNYLYGQIFGSTREVKRSSAKYVRLAHPNSNVGAIQLEEGTTATDYEPYHEPITTNIYLDEPLGEGQSINYKKDGLPKLPTFKGTSILSAETTTQPSNAEVTYYSTLKG